MKKRYLIGFTLLTFSTTFAVQADTQRYISDDLSTWVRSGPGEQYRLAGTVHAGEPVTLLQTSGDYAQIRDSSGRSVWLPLTQLSEQPSLRIRVPTLEKQVKDLTDKLTSIDDNWKKQTADMHEKVAVSDETLHRLKEENHQLKNQLIVAQKKVNVANVQLDDKQRTIIMQWFMYGGGVAGIGLLVGLLLPHMIPRRKKNDRWMN
ncbi:TIGR04211 family SH3 domain-containing protein [Enterobacteriaceae bacterium LUAb1]